MQHLQACAIAHLLLLVPINQSHHWTGFAYRMYRWPTDLTVTFSFLDWSPCCFSDDYFFFQLTNLPPWYTTVLLSYPTHPDVGQPVSSPCITQSVSQGTVAISPQIILVLVFPWQVFLYLFSAHNREVFPQSLDLARCFSLIYLIYSSPTVPSPHLTSPCKFLTSLPLVPLSCFVLSYRLVSFHTLILCHTLTYSSLTPFPPHCLTGPVSPSPLVPNSLCPCQETNTYPQITPSEPHRVYAVDLASSLAFYDCSHTLGTSMVIVMLKHVDFLSATITCFTQLDQEGDLCIWEDLLFKNLVQRF